VGEGDPRGERQGRVNRPEVYRFRRFGRAGFFCAAPSLMKPIQLIIAIGGARRSAEQGPADGMRPRRRASAPHNSLIQTPQP
jgi:hypothetical protein